MEDNTMNKVNKLDVRDKKLSSYNVALTDKGRVFLVNTLSDGVISLDTNGLREFNEIASTINTGYIPLECLTSFEILSANGFILDRAFDESSFLRLYNTIPDYYSRNEMQSELFLLL